MVKEIKLKSKENGQVLVTIRTRSGHDITGDLLIIADGSIVFMEEDGKRKD